MNTLLMKDLKDDGAVPPKAGAAPSAPSSVPSSNGPEQGIHHQERRTRISFEIHPTLLFQVLLEAEDDDSSLADLLMDDSEFGDDIFDLVQYHRRQ